MLVSAASNLNWDSLAHHQKFNTSDWYIEPEKKYGYLYVEKRGKIKSAQVSYLGYYDAMFKSIVNTQLIAVTTADVINIMRVIKTAINSINQQ